MIDWDKRIIVIIKIWDELLDELKDGTRSEFVFLDKIIEQEKEMIRDFAKEIKRFPVQSATPNLTEYVNKLLKQMEIEEI